MEAGPQRSRTAQCGQRMALQASLSVLDYWRPTPRRLAVQQYMISRISSCLASTGAGCRELVEGLV